VSTSRAKKGTPEHKRLEEYSEGRDAWSYFTHHQARSRAYRWGEDEDGRRPVFGGTTQFQTDPYCHDLLLFHEHFHGDNGAGTGASHRTGWTGTVAPLFLETIVRRSGPQATVDRAS